MSKSRDTILTDDWREAMTNTTTFGPAQDCFSLEKQAKLNRSEATIALGKMLTSQLGIDGSVDTLGRWMAHYVAELITMSEQVNTEDPANIRKTCFEAILQLWKHRASLPTGLRPLEEVEPIIKALASLNPECDTFRYIRSTRTPVGQDATEAAEQKNDHQVDLLHLAEGIDYTARLLIRYFLAMAAAPHQEDGAKWVNMALASGGDNDPAVVALTTLDLEHRLNAGEWREETAALLVRERAEKLECFAALASKVASKMRAALEKASDEAAEHES